jgi:predicted DNA binding CopG/RHH family protein
MKKKSKKSGTRISDEEFDLALDKALNAKRSEVKIRVNTFIDLDIYDALKEEADKTGQKYQTLLNKYLRAAVLMEVSEADIKAIKIALSH